ncbi:MAG: hypothetical protein CME63_17315 [Halobacteriovoraceae bacterium]|nr:hypothetical protein [Halobacteriovoraceae bacterium]MBC99507.1 hypothetical protein [Halobacteriovoraceae bacterium]
MTGKEIFIFDKQKQKKIFFKKSISLGRSNACDIRINDKEISSHHITITVSLEGVQIEDFNSFNGTYLNGAKLDPKVKYPLQVKDIIQVGEHCFFFNSEEGNMDFLDLPSFTGSLSMATSDSNIIVHDKFEPITVEERTDAQYSLKGLRSNKEKINSIKKRIQDFAKIKEERKLLLGEIDQKKIEIEEFDNYFKMKNYRSENDILKTISSVEMVNKKVSDEIEGVKHFIAKLQNEINKLNQQITTFQNQIQESQKEKGKNLSIIEELNTDLEIFRGRGGLIEEWQELQRKLKKYNSLRIDDQVAKLQEVLVEEEKALKNAQKNYAQKKFGSDGLFQGNKKNKAS